MKPQDVDDYARHEFSLAEQVVYDDEIGSIPMDLDGATVLDLGAGPGTWCHFFAEIGTKKVVWMDNSNRFLSHAHAYFSGIPEIRYVLADMLAIPIIKANVLDLVYCRGALHHSTNESEALKEIHRVLRPGGVAAISALAMAHDTREVLFGWKKPFHYLTPYAAVALGRKIAPTPYHLRPLHERNLRNAGLEIVNQVEVDPVVLWIYARKPEAPSGTSEGITARDEIPDAIPDESIPKCSGSRCTIGLPSKRGDRPLVSVVIPTFNRARLCKIAVNSALAQTYRPLEVIVVDDGSTDETPHIFADCEPPVRYVRQENSERAAARNRGVVEARGEFVAFLDSDDFWSRRHLERAVDLILANPDAVLSFGRAVYTTHRGIPLREAPSPRLQRGLVGSDEAIMAMAMSVVPFPLSSVVARREALLKHKFNEDLTLSRSEDWELWVRLAARYPVVSTGDPSTFIRMHSGNTSQEADSVSRAMNRAYELVFEDPIARSRLTPYARSLRAAMELELARLNAMAGRKALARSSLKLIERDGANKVDSRAVRRLKVMLVLPLPVANAIRRLIKFIDIALGLIAGRSIRREVKKFGFSPNPYSDRIR